LQPSGHGNGSFQFSIEHLNTASFKEIRKAAVDRVEKEIISKVLAHTGWNRSQASKILQISYKTLLYKISELDIEPPTRL
jgi:DNA-binding NtrC family response regulator